MSAPLRGDVNIQIPDPSLLCLPPKQDLTAYGFQGDLSYGHLAVNNYTP